VDDVLLVADHADATLALAETRGLLFGASLPEVPSRKERFAEIRKAFERLESARVALRLAGRPEPPEGTFPIVFGGEIAQNVLSGNVFGFRPKFRGGESGAPAPPKMTVRETTELQQRVMLWLGGLSKNAGRASSHGGDRLATRLIADLSRRFERKVLSLEDFSGDETERQLEWSPLEVRLLELLRQARRELPLFTDDRPRDVLAWEYHRFLGYVPEIPVERIPEKWRIPPEVQVRWEAIDSEPYDEAIAALSEWLDDEYARQITAETIRNDQLEVRASRLFERLEFEVELEHDPAPRADDKLDTGIYEVFEELREGGLLNAIARGEPAIPSELSPLASILLQYLKQAVRHNPMFEDLDTVLGGDEIDRRYDDYIQSGRDPSEQQAYDQAVRALEIHAGLVEGDVASLQPKPTRTTIDERSRVPEPSSPEPSENATKTPETRVSATLPAGSATSNSGHTGRHIVWLLALLAALSLVLAFMKRRSKQASAGRS
jgi:hypothetical protein